MTVIEIFETFNADDPGLDEALDKVDGIVVPGDSTPEAARRFAGRVTGMAMRTLMQMHAPREAPSAEVH